MQMCVFTPPHERGILVPHIIPYAAAGGPRIGDLLQHQEGVGDSDRAHGASLAMQYGTEFVPQGPSGLECHRSPLLPSGASGDRTRTPRAYGKNYTAQMYSMQVFFQSGNQATGNRGVSGRELSI